MNIRTIKYYLVEGAVNLIRYKVMSLASISIMVSALILLGAFLVITENIKSNTKSLNEQPEMQVFCSYKLDDTQVLELQKKIDKNLRIDSVTMISKKDAMKKVKDYLGTEKALLEGLDESFLPVSFIIKLKDPAQAKIVAKEIETYEGVDKVKYSQNVIEFVSNIVSWIQYSSAALVLLLMIISTFIISNTIKLAMYARRREIGIMKYIGATNWFIRWPFIIEGIIIGLVSTVIAMLAVGFGYHFFYGSYATKLEGLFNLLTINSLAVQIFVVYLVAGTLVGIVGSVISIKRYLEV